MKYHTVQIKIYAPVDLFGWIVYSIGFLFGVMKEGRCHATIAFSYNTGLITERHLCIEGVRLLFSNVIKGDELKYKPLRVFTYKVSTRQILEMHSRIGKYEKGDMRVTVGSLVSALIKPKQINYNLCTSFCQYVVFGKVTVSANRIEQFIKELEYECHR